MFPPALLLRQAMQVTFSFVWLSYADVVQLAYMAGVLIAGSFWPFLNVSIAVYLSR
jgi:hypothetical protein